MVIKRVAVNKKNIPVIGAKFNFIASEPIKATMIW
jgi:hypothetical protein